MLKCDLEDASLLLEKDLDIELKVHRERRSLDANAYAWVLMSQIAAEIQTSKEEVYHKMLVEYGVFRFDDDGAPKWHILPTENDPDIHLMYTGKKVSLQSKRGEKAGYVYLELKGSSEYNTKEMSDLISGIVYEAQQLGIQTETENSIREMMERYGR